jgi:hypothetical protein
MNLTDDEILKFQRGSPVFLEDICAIYPAKMGEIVDLGYSKFQQYLSVVLVEKPTNSQMQDETLKELISSLTDFQYLLMLTALDIEANQLLKGAFQFFTHENITISLDPAQIIIGPLEENHLLTEEKFYDFQRIIKRMYFIEQDGEEIIINPDDPPHVRRLKEKMRENRNKVRKAKAKQAEREKSDLKFSDLIGSLTIDNCGLNMENVWNITYYAFHDQLRRMGWRDQFNINNQAALAGAKLKKNQLKHWMRSIASSDKS